MAAIYTLDGNELTAGLQGCNTCDEALQAAERYADALGADVHLVDDDGEWIVHPAVGGKREAADRHEGALSSAAVFRSRYGDSADLMTALDDAGIKSDQDWANECTTWTFGDGSRIVVSGPEITVLRA